MGRAQRGEAAAFEALVRRHFRAAYSVALAVLQSAAEAEDVAQESLLVAFQRLDTCREPERFAGWLVQIVRNRALNALESNKLRSRTAERANENRPQSAQALEVAGEKERLVAALSQVSAAQREVVLLHDLEGWTHPENRRLAWHLGSDVAAAPLPGAKDAAGPAGRGRSAAAAAAAEGGAS
ncbi:MAG: RNA polymerase sigma factor [Myxococcales bacterium]